MLRDSVFISFIYLSSGVACLNAHYKETKKHIIILWREVEDKLRNFAREKILKTIFRNFQVLHPQARASV